MSDEAQPAESQEDPPFSLSALDIGPAWARGGAGGKTGESEGKEKRRREDGGGKGKRRDDRRDRRDGRRDDRRDDRRDGRQDDRRDGRQGGNRRFERGGGGGGGRRSDYKGRGRRGDDRDARRREEVSPPEGFTAEIMPVEAGLDSLGKEILASGRTYSVFDLAKLVLGGRERFRVNFRTNGKGDLYRCVKDGSLWMSRDEALRHFWRADWRGEFYEEVTSEASPPKGNFQAVARCGISGEWLGPPNYHGYQTALMQLHRERFSTMPIDLYKRKVRMERGEEAVSAWLEQMSKKTRFRPVTGDSAPDEESSEEASEPANEAGREAAPAEEAPGDAEPAGETAAPAGEGDESNPTLAEAGGGGETPREENAASDEENDATGEGSGASEEGSSESTSEEVLLDEKRDVDRHFLENGFADAFVKCDRAWVIGDVPGNHLSPPLLTLLRHVVAEERRYPGKLTPMLCRQLSGRHVAVFKWRRKLKAGPSRPHPVPDDITIAERPTSLLNWVREHSGRNLEKLWKDLLPKDVSDEDRHGWYHDLHWLLNQGYVLLMADSTLHIAKKEGGPEVGAKAPKKKAAKKKAAEARPTPAVATSEPSVEIREGTSAAPVVRSSAPGLYALTATTLGGEPKSPAYLVKGGLWPLPRRIEGLEEEGQEEEEESPESW